MNPETCPCVKYKNIIDVKHPHTKHRESIWKYVFVSQIL